MTCYELIYSDLNQAITYYQASGITRKEDENHKININAAYATYARAALTREDWNTAAHYAALARAGYPLMNTNEYFNGFNTVNREWIWSIYDSEEESLGNASLAARLAYNSTSALVCTYPACINRELYDALPESDSRRRRMTAFGSMINTARTAWVLDTLGCSIPYRWDTFIFKSAMTGKST